MDDADLKGAGDMEVARYAKENELILVTEDKRKFVEFMKLLGGRYVLVDNPMLVNMKSMSSRKNKGSSSPTLKHGTATHN